MILLQFRGYVTLAERLASGAPGPGWNTECPAALNIALSEDATDLIEKCSGFDGVLARIVNSQTAQVNLSLYDVSKQNLMLALQGTDVPTVTGGSITNELLPAGIIAGSVQRLGGITGHQNITGLVLSDSGGPMTLATEYTFNAYTGQVTFLVTPVYPVDADYTFDDLPKIAMFNGGSKEYYTFFDARNKQDNLRPSVVELYRTRYAPASNIDLLSDGVGTIDLVGSVLTDDKKANDDVLGKFGWISYY